MPQTTERELIEVHVGELKQLFNSLDPTLLYDWWPIRAEARRFDRLSQMSIRVIPSRQ